jgi:hypothetical protein
MSRRKGDKNKFREKLHWNKHKSKIWVERSWKRKKKSGRLIMKWIYKYVTSKTFCDV